MAMDQYLLIPFLGGWTSIYQLFWCSPGVQGFDTLLHLCNQNVGCCWLFCLKLIGPIVGEFLWSRPSHAQQNRQSWSLGTPAVPSWQLTEWKWSSRDCPPDESSNSLLCTARTLTIWPYHLAASRLMMKKTPKLITGQKWSLFHNDGTRNNMEGTSNTFKYKQKAALVILVSCNPACWLCNLLAPASSFACFACRYHGIWDDLRRVWTFKIRHRTTHPVNEES